MKNNIKIIIFLMLLPNILIWAITREDVLNKARSYSNLNWTVNTVNTKYAIFSVKGKNITGEAYSWGDKATTSWFLNEIEAGLIPRNWESNFNSNTQTKYTGIDCSGLVTRSLGFSEHLVNWTNAGAIANYCVGVTQAKPGDIWIGPKHTFLEAYGGQVYEANSEANIVKYNPNGHSSYGMYSIFPQFDKEDPFDGKVINGTVSDLDISVYIYGRGDFTTDNVSMFVNGIKETNTEIIVKSDTSVQFIAHDNLLNSWSGEVNVEVTARNDITGILV